MAQGVVGGDQQEKHWKVCVESKWGKQPRSQPHPSGVSLGPSIGGEKEANQTANIHPGPTRLASFILASTFHVSAPKKHGAGRIELDFSVSASGAWMRFFFIPYESSVKVNKVQE